MQIEKKQIAYNRVARSGAIKYIVIHDTCLLYTSAETKPLSCRLMAVNLAVLHSTR